MREREGRNAGACIESSGFCGNFKLLTYALNFSARQVLSTKGPKYWKIKYFGTPGGGEDTALPIILRGGAIILLILTVINIIDLTI